MSELSKMIEKLSIYDGYAGNKDLDPNAFADALIEALKKEIVKSHVQLSGRELTCKWIDEAYQSLKG
jgi:hypothetical protein